MKAKLKGKLRKRAHAIHIQWIVSLQDLTLADHAPWCEVPGLREDQVDTESFE